MGRSHMITIDNICRCISKIGFSRSSHVRLGWGNNMVICRHIIMQMSRGDIEADIFNGGNITRSHLSLILIDELWGGASTGRNVL